jgi:transglutaminase-like putative cysteine protease
MATFEAIQACTFRPVWRRATTSIRSATSARGWSPSGLLEVRSEFVIEDGGLPDEVCPFAKQWEIDQLPSGCLPFLLGSRYCDTERLSNLAWSLFGNIQGGWQRAQAICDYAHDRIEFGYHHARGDRTAPRDMTSAAASVGILPISR